MKLIAKVREENKKAKHLRRSEEVPAVLYGKGVKNLHLSLNLKEFSKIYKDAGEATILDLEIDNKGKKEDKNILIHEVSLDPVSGDIIHTDLYQVDMKKEVTAHVPLAFEGLSEAVKLGGILIRNMHEIEVTALPKDLPSKITVDISKLATMDDVITIADLNIAEGVKIELHKEDVVASVSAPRTDAELAADLAQPEAAQDLSAIKTEGDEKKEKKEAEAQAEAAQQEKK